MLKRAPPLIVWLYAVLIAGGLTLAAAAYSFFVLGDLWSFLV